MRSGTGPNKRIKTRTPSPVGGSDPLQDSLSALQEQYTVDEPPEYASGEQAE